MLCEYWQLSFQASSFVQSLFSALFRGERYCEVIVKFNETSVRVMSDSSVDCVFPGSSGLGYEELACGGGACMFLLLGSGLALAEYNNAPKDARMRHIAIRYPWLGFKSCWVDDAFWLR